MSQKRVLIVDDDTDICANIKDILDDLGYRTDVAHDGPDALELIDSQRYDVAVLDFCMPGMDGAALHDEIIKRRPEIAAIMVTAYAHGDGAQRARDGGIQQVLRKPVDLGELLPLIDDLAHSPVVLVVDDDPEFCQTLWHLLRERSFRVCLAYTKEDGITKASDGDYQIALIDLSLCQGSTDGCDVMRQVAQTHPHARTILITGYRDETDHMLDDLKARGVSDICYKPLDMNRLFKLIESSDG
ncbi:Response regulator receiver protein [Stieleria bergensis]|uniref:Response regulator receiver protein n=1 Tax=Stieleria bergensis TaxID=2528025 RepID=A0A517SZ44_9BACT|nr:Response regulator receiver protein [Planctomycetes bacterium SV_7m_r]